MKPRIDVISGFLGAGKTTLILELIKRIPEGERIAVCENEYGEVGIDSDALKGRDFEVVEINAGCVCCTLPLNLISGIKMLIAQHHPTRIILEPTGIASLSEILRILQDKDLAGVADIGTPAAVIDGGATLSYFERFRAGIENQIAAASVLFVNRIDQLSGEEKLELGELIERINPEAHIVAEPLDAAAIWKALDAPRHVTSTILGLPKSWMHGFKQVAVFTGWPGSREKLDEFLAAQLPVGVIVRAKGYVTDGRSARFRVDLAGNAWSYRPVEKDGPDMLQFIGRNLAVNIIEKFFIEQ
jgi:G3E family GTPase